MSRSFSHSLDVSSRFCAQLQPNSNDPRPGGGEGRANARRVCHYHYRLRCLRGPAPRVSFLLNADPVTALVLLRPRSGQPSSCRSSRGSVGADGPPSGGRQRASGGPGVVAEADRHPGEDLAVRAHRVAADRSEEPGELDRAVAVHAGPDSFAGSGDVVDLPSFRVDGVGPPPTALTVSRKSPWRWRDSNHAKPI
jgi:hypothetical protein